MGDDEAGVWYALTLSIGNEGKGPGCDSWDPPLEMNRWLRPKSPGWDRAARRDGRVVTPPVDVRIRKDEIELFADLPGIPRENIDIRVLPRHIEIVGIPAGGDEARDSAVGAALKGPEWPGHEIYPAATRGARALLRDGVLELRVSRNALLSGSGGGPVPVR